MSTTIASKTRHAVVDEVKRNFIREAAKKLFSEHGIDGTSVRDIAREAGYTTGAIYFHYQSKEALYADILKESLEELHAVVSGTAGSHESPVERLTAAFKALVSFYAKNPRDLDLSLYLYQGARPRGLTTKANQELNERLMAVMDIYRACFVEINVPPERLNIEVAGLFDEMIGTLIAAHTGRLKLFGVNLHTMTEHHIQNIRRCWLRVD